MLRTLAVAAVLTALAAPPANAAGPALETDDQKAIYSIGLSIAQNLKPFNLSDAEVELVKAGISDGLADAGKVDMMEFRSRIQQLGQQRAAEVAAAESKAAEPFLEKMAKEKGAAKSDSGLVYITVKEGTGESPKATDTVKVHYHGTLRDGTVFDSSVERGDPATFPLNRVIACWTEGVQKMKVGGKAKLVCPASIAYGDRGAPPKIKPGAALVFEVELLEIVAGAEKPGLPPGHK